MRIKQVSSRQAMKISDNDIIFIPYPAWVREKIACKLFSVGKLTLREWRRKGLIKVADTSGSQKNIVYRSSDIDRIIMSISEGRSPVKHTEYFGKAG